MSHASEHPGAPGKAEALESGRLQKAGRKWHVENRVFTCDKRFDLPISTFRAALVYIYNLYRYLIITKVNGILSELLSYLN